MCLFGKVTVQNSQFSIQMQHFIDDFDFTKLSIPAGCCIIIFHSVPFLLQQIERLIEDKGGGIDNDDISVK